MICGSSNPAIKHHTGRSSLCQGVQGVTYTPSIKGGVLTWLDDSWQWFVIQLMMIRGSRVGLFLARQSLAALFLARQSLAVNVYS